MKLNWVYAIGITLAVNVASSVVNFALLAGLSMAGMPKDALTVVSFIVSLIIVCAISGWAACDSVKIEVTKYESMIAYRPVGVFLGIFLLEIIALPIYLSIRFKIMNGTAKLKAR